MTSLLYHDSSEVNLSELKTFLRRYLLENIVPFWERHAFSSQRPGIDTCMADDGTLLSTDRYLWSQLRATWTFSALYNRIERRAEWLDHARNLFEFTAAHGREPSSGRWCFRLSPEGRILTGPNSIYTDGFAILGYTEYYRASGDSRALDLALETFEQILPRLERWHEMQTAPYEIPPGMKAHGVSMIYSYVFGALAEVTPDPRVAEAAAFHCREVTDHYLRPDTGLIMEYIGLDNTTADTPEGRTVVPGHAIESAWFQIQQLEKRNDQERIDRMVRAIRRHFEVGWDEQDGGLLLGIDAQGKTPIYWKHHDTKLWWPATEAMVALLKAHTLCGEPWCLDYYRRIHNYAFTHYPVPEHGEWCQRLDRKGKPMTEVIALPVKDPFHLPRALILSINLLEAMTGKQA